MSLQMTLKFADGKAMKVNVEENEDVDKVKEAVQEKLGFEVDKQRLIYAGSQLDGGRTWRDYGIKFKPEPVVFVVLKS